MTRRLNYMIQSAAVAASRPKPDTAFPWDDPATIERVVKALRNKSLALVYPMVDAHWEGMARAAIEAAYSHEA